MVINLPEKVKKIIRTIEDAGYEAYAVGGCVRDSLLNRKPDDWDITTSAKPLQIKSLFCHTIDTGLIHGTVTVMLDREGFEVTTYRIDGEYEDSRHPKEVTFTAELAEDLKRRDFTINAMAYNDSCGLIDLFGGISDIESKTIRCVGNPRERFKEDALRMMRAVRFSAQLGYRIDGETKAAVREMSENLRNISAERIMTELVKLIVSPHPQYLGICYETGITAVIFPEFDRCMETGQNNPHHCFSVGEHILHSMEGIRADKALRLAMLFHDIGKPCTKTTDKKGVDHFHGHAAVGEKMAGEILRRLKADNDTINKVSKLTLYHDCEMGNSRKSVRRAIHKTGEELFPYLFEIKAADIYAQSGYKKKEKYERLDEIKQIYREIMESKDCVSLRTLAVSGRDLIDAGMTPGKELGDKLNELLELVIDTPSLNTKETLLTYVNTRVSDTKTE